MNTLILKAPAMKKSDDMKHLYLDLQYESGPKGHVKQFIITM